jgi:two-component system, OmpR family, response regulator VicR
MEPECLSTGKKIVVVEADEDFLHLIPVILADCGAELVLARTGRNGLSVIRDCRPDLVILDLTLPDMNGWEVFIQLRDTPPGESVLPVIILADEGTRFDRTFSLQVAQVQDYLMKPFLPSQLQESVAEALKLAERPADRALEATQRGPCHD